MDGYRNRIIALLIALASLLQAVSVGINAVIFPTALESYGVSKPMIGLVMAVEWVSVFLVSGSLPRLLSVVPMFTWITLSTIIRLSALLLLGATTELSGWFLLIALHGLGNVLFDPLLQIWVNRIPFERARGLYIALYGTSISVGLAAGPILLTALDVLVPTLTPVLQRLDVFLAAYLDHMADPAITPSTRLAMLLSAILSTVAILPLLAARQFVPSLSRNERSKPLNTLARAPAVMFAFALGGITMLGLQNFISLFGINNELSLEEAGLLLSAFMLGGIVLDMPVAWISDHFDRRYVMMALVLLSLVAAVGLPMTIHDPWMASALLFGWGGISGGLYSICNAVLADRFDESEQVAANGMASMMEAGGGFLGNVAIGAAMSVFAMDGLPYVLMFACVLYFTFALTRYPVR